MLLDHFTKLMYVNLVFFHINLTAPFVKLFHAFCQFPEKTVGTLAKRSLKLTTKNSFHRQQCLNSLKSASATTKNNRTLRTNPW